MFNQVSKSDNSSRILQLNLRNNTFSTPAYFPVLYCYELGFWDRITHKIVNQYPQNPFLINILMHSEKGKLSKKLEARVRTNLHSKYSAFKGSFFLDSGGYKLYKINKILDPEDVFSIQTDAGGDLIASLDYPINDQMSSYKQRRRMIRSINNAIKYLEMHRYHFQNTPGPLVYLAIHGLSNTALKQYFQKLTTKLKSKKLFNYPFGLALGSLAGLRTNRQKLIKLVAYAKKHAQNFGLGDRPFHTFGVSGTAIPFLVNLGVDSFDSTSYFIMAKNLQLLDPLTLQTINLNAKNHTEKRLVPFATKRGLAGVDYNNLEQHWDCSCFACQKSCSIQSTYLLQKLTMGWAENATLTQNVKNLGFNDREDLMINLFYHNLESTFNLVENIKENIKTNTFQNWFDNYFSLLTSGVHKSQKTILNGYLKT